MTTAMIKQALEMERNEGNQQMELAKLTKAGDENAGRDSALAEDTDPNRAMSPDSGSVEVKVGFLKRCMNKCGRNANANKKQIGFESNPNLRVKNTIKRIVNGRFVLTLMTFVTVFALIGVSAHSNLNCSRFD